jgi:hypothetical protein
LTPAHERLAHAPQHAKHVNAYDKGFACNRATALRMCYLLINQATESGSMMRLMWVGLFLWCSLALAAPRAPKVTSGKSAVQKSEVPNPNGRKGSKEHQAKVKEVAEDVKARGLKPEEEHMVKTPEGAKSKRFVDVAGVNESTQKVEEMHQVGRQTKSGQPVAREKDAMDDIQKATGKRPQFHPYK